MAFYLKFEIQCFKQQNARENIVCKTAAILSRTQCVDILRFDGWHFFCWLHFEIQYGAVITRSVFSEIFITDTHSSLSCTNDDTLRLHMTLLGQIIHWAPGGDVMISAMASQIAGSGADQRKHQSSASLAFVRGIHRWPLIPRTKDQ